MELNFNGQQVIGPFYKTNARRLSSYWNITDLFELKITRASMRFVGATGGAPRIRFASLKHSVARMLAAFYQAMSLGKHEPPNASERSSMNFSIIIFSI